MINRVLIRIKVVQLLYSYLLSQNEFRIEAQVENPSRDKKYGYALYLDLLMLVLELSGIDVSNGRRESPLRGLSLNKHIHQSLLAKSLNSNFEIRDIIIKERAKPEAFDSVIPTLYRAIAELPAYKSFAKIKTPTLHDEVTLWLSIVENIFAQNAEFMAIARRNPDFTMAGFERGIASLKSTLGNYGDNRSLVIHARNSLDHAMEKAYELYYSLLQLGIELTNEQALRLDNAKHKFYPTDADLHPDMRFVENKYIQALISNPRFNEYIENNKVSWVAQDTMTSTLLNEVLQSDAYLDYMASPGEKTLEEDAALWRTLYKNVILPSDTLAEALESKSIYWNDDLQEMGTFVLKTIRRIAIATDEDSATSAIMPMYKDEEDSHFGADMLSSAIKHCDEYKELIEKFVNTARWDADRLAFMDIVIMVAAITEIIDYPAIPLAVSLNEYIEIANHYSTPRSGSFINGILYSVVKYLKEENKIFKS
ncbi:transcription antitermination factor NusB [Duncaniella muricolitica]|uniref:transcription antitermination factor NusB n=1 Tax=Duncaniella muricolitica TaxID=2880704 RepID=UPI00244E3F3E|nr:transcription antitermination factor NusB [Duncaniella muricolitica]